MSYLAIFVVYKTKHIKCVTVKLAIVFVLSWGAQNFALKHPLKKKKHVSEDLDLMIIN